MASPSPAPALKPRSRPMEVLVLGLCRTGTVSIGTALEQLGLEKGSVYHAANVFRTPGHADKWLAALKAKYEGVGKPFGKEEWDDLLGDCSAITDIPASLFAVELIAAYPSARVILTTRSPSSWLASMKATIWASQIDPLRPWERLFYPSHLESIAKLFDYIFDVYFYGNFERYAERVFVEHGERVKLAALASGSQYLEFEAKQGWKPLCKLLEKDVPVDGEGKEKMYPRSNDAEAWRRMFKTGEKWGRVKKIGGLGIAGLVVAGAVTWAWVK